jgi:hypothetical protein
MKNKRIAFVIPSLQPGGMERVMSEIIEFCSRKPKVEIHLVLFGIDRDVFYEIPPSVIIHKPNFEFDSTKRSWHTLKTIYFIRKTIIKINPNTILSYVIENKGYLSYINIYAFKVIMQEIKCFPKHNFDYLELICWMVSYTKFVKTYKDELETPVPFSSKSLALKAKIEYRILTKGRQFKTSYL